MPSWLKLDFDEDGAGRAGTRQAPDKADVGAGPASSPKMDGRVEEDMETGKDGSRAIAGRWRVGAMRLEMFCVLTLGGSRRQSGLELFAI